MKKIPYEQLLEEHKAFTKIYKKVGLAYTRSDTQEMDLVTLDEIVSEMVDEIKDGETEREELLAAFRTIRRVVGV